MTVTEENLNVSNERTAPAIDQDWVVVCAFAQLQPERGIAVLVHNEPVALFRVAYEGSDRVYALSHTDPVSGTPTMARGIVGSHDGRPIVAAPLWKERYDLATGDRLDDGGRGLEIFDARVHDGQVEVRANVISAKSARNIGSPD